MRDENESSDTPTSRSARYPAIKFIDDRRKEATCFRATLLDGGTGRRKEEREQGSIDAESNSDSNGTPRADLPRGLKNI